MLHRGEAQMQINDTIEYLPMLDGLQISQLQRLALGVSQCANSIHSRKNFDQEQSK